MTDNENLITEASAAILEAAKQAFPEMVIGERAEAAAFEYARCAFAVFEKAHIPTDPNDDEQAIAESVERIRDWNRPGYVYMSERGRIADLKLVLDAAGFRRSEVPDPSAARALLAQVHEFATRERDSIRGQYGAGSSTYAGYANACDDILGILGGMSPHPSAAEPQGEPSDAQVLAALNEMHGPYYAVPLDLTYYTGNQVDQVRRILRAASSVTEQGENR